MKRPNWLSRESEVRQESYSDTVVALMLAQAAGVNTARPDDIATVEACAGIIGRSFAAAAATEDVGMTPLLMMTLGRELTLRGELVCWIRLNADGTIGLRPSAYHDVRYGGTDPDTWTYRLQLPVPSGQQLTRLVPADEVIHWRVNATAAEPWRGRSPLSLSPLTAGLAATLELRSRQEAGGPVGQLLPVPEQPTPEPDPDDPEATLDPLAPLQAALSQLKGGVALVEGMTAGWGEPTRRDQTRGWQTQRLGGDVPQTHHLLLSAAEIAIMGACGVPPTLFSPSGADTREAWRRFATATMEPLGKIVLEEVHAKLDTGASLDWSPLHASDIAGRARGFQTLVAGGMDIERAAALAGLLEGD